MTVSVVITQNLMDEIQTVLEHPEETAGVLLASIVETPNGSIRLLARKIRWVEDAAYIRREKYGMTIKPEGYIPALSEAEEIGATAIWLHTHPWEGASPEPSEYDHIVDTEISDLFRIRAGSSFYGTLIFSPIESGLTFTGYLQSEGEKLRQIERMWQVVEKWQLIQSYNTSRLRISPIFDRNVRAFGPIIQQTLGDLTVGIVGCGGTGSIVSEQLVRLGVRKIILIDPDELTESNITRVYGSKLADVGKAKVQILKEHLSEIAPDLECEIDQSMVVMEASARLLIGCDVIFGCTDDNAGRMVLSRLSSFFLIPVIDCGVLLSSDSSGQLMGIDGRVTILTPGQACLICRNRIDMERAGSELLTPEERIRLENEGYAPALAQTEPAVVTFTTFVGSTAVSELLERLIGYGPDPRPSEVLLRCHDREISTNILRPKEHHYCHPDSGKLGIGVTVPFLEQMWPTP